VNKQTESIRKVLGKERALVAISGGVDSTTSAVLVYRAVGANLLCVMLDDAFMREGEPERVALLLSQPPLNMPVKVINVRERFLSEMKELRDAEEKRKVFRENFYKSLSEIAQREGCRFLVQGTILADIIETAGGVKTQHNVLSQIGINPRQRYGFQIIEPLSSLLKWQVREVARHLKIPREISERQPFPGPGLSVRVVGEIKRDKLEALKKATAITEERLAEHRPDQYFAVILDNAEEYDHPSLPVVREKVAQLLEVSASRVSIHLFEDKATGIKEGERRYGEIVAVKAEGAEGLILTPPILGLVMLQNKITAENPSFTRIFYTVHETKQRKPYVVAVRAVQTQDFLTAKVAEIPWATLKETAQDIITACPNVSSVYYDVTPKPPATIEME